MAPMQDHVVIADHTGASVPGAGDLPAGMDQTPGASDKVELVKVIAICTVIS